jgi:hypothetical protein
MIPRGSIRVATNKNSSLALFYTQSTISIASIHQVVHYLSALVFRQHLSNP